MRPALDPSSRPPRATRLATAAAALIAALACLASGFGATFEDDLRTARDGLRSRAASGEVLVVEIDKASIDAFGSWPWPRSRHADLVARLADAGVRSIAFDVDFSAPSEPSHDRALARALAASGGIVTLATLKQPRSAGSDEMVESMPLPAFRDHVFVGTVNMGADADGNVRTLPLGTDIGGAIRPSLAAMIVEAPAGGAADYRVDYAIDPTTLPRVSVADVVAGRVHPERLRGKRVVVGATAVELGDRYAVPGHGVIPGVFIQALGAETLLRGVPRELGPVLPLLPAILGVLALMSRHRFVRRAGYVGAGAAVALIPLALESWANASAGAVPALAALAAAGATAALMRVNQSLRIRAQTDAATGLPNALALGDGAAPASPCHLVVAVIDGSGAIATSLGPEGMAELIRRVAERLSFGSRGAAVHRIDEGALAWLAEDDGGVLDDHFDGLAALMRAPVEVAGRRIDLAVHFGVAAGRADRARALAAEAADAAREAAKAGERWRFYVAGDGDEASWRLSLLGEIDQALARGDLWVAHQPKLDIATGRIAGSEALVRWQHPERGAIPPDRFIPVVESAGRIGELTAHVLRAALADAARFEAEGLRLGVAVNMSATLLAKPDLVPAVLGALADAGVSPATLTLEVTESAAMADDAALTSLYALRDAGVNLSVDDYGTGQSTLTYLKRLPAGEVKIDQSFVRPIATSRSDAILVRSTIELAHQLGLKVVAEGVENEACLAILADMGADTAQGWHIGRPMAAEDFLRYVRSWNDGERRRAA